MNAEHPLGLLRNSRVIMDSRGRKIRISAVQKDVFPLQVHAQNYEEGVEVDEKDRIFLDLIIGAEVTEKPWFTDDQIIVWYPMSAMDRVLGKALPEKESAADENILHVQMNFKSSDHSQLSSDCRNVYGNAITGSVNDNAEDQMTTRMGILVIEVFAYGFIILISLVAAANVFNMISTGVILRKREFAMLRSVGMSRRGLRRMLSYECLRFGLLGLLSGIPVSIAVT